jgi:hypothetical protein
MFVLRLIAILVIIALSVTVLAYFWTRNMRYLRFAWRLIFLTIVLLLLLFGFYAAERLLMVL